MHEITIKFYNEELDKCRNDKPEIYKETMGEIVKHCTKELSEMTARDIVMLIFSNDK